jgi:hypothetical protein
MLLLLLLLRMNLLEIYLQDETPLRSLDGRLGLLSRGGKRGEYKNNAAPHRPSRYRTLAVGVLCSVFREISFMRHFGLG